MVKMPGLAFTLTGCAAPHCKFSLPPTNSRTNILISQPLGGRSVTPGDKRPVAQRALRLSVQKRSSRRIKNSAAGSAQNCVARRRVPFHRWGESRIDVAEALGDEAKLER